MSLVNIALVGATGELGAHILDALIAEGTFNITLLQRASSSSSRQHPAHPATTAATVPDAPTLAQLTALLRGHDALIVCYRARDAAAQILWGRAAAAAGVRRLIPADFGSVDAGAARWIGLFARKVRVRESLEALAAEHAAFSWTSVVNGHFFDWGLRESFLHFDLAARRAWILDDGAARASHATLAQVARATVRVLLRPAETRNRVLLVQSFCISQNELLAAVERATGAEWEVERFDSAELVREMKAKADAGDADALEDLIFVVGATNGNLEGRPGFAMDLLGLENEDLDTVVQQVVDEFNKRSK